jgi:hypothetical protein
MLLFNLVLAAYQGAASTPETYEVPTVVEQKDEK